MGNDHRKVSEAERQQGIDYAWGEAKKNAFMIHNGIRIEEMGPERTVATVDVQHFQTNPYGFTHGGVYFTLMDCCASMMARSDGRRYVTLNAEIHYLRSTGETKITAVAVPLKRGKTTCVASVECRGEDGRILSSATVTLFCTGEGVKAEKGEAKGKME